MQAISGNLQLSCQSYMALYDDFISTCWQAPILMTEEQSCLTANSIGNTASAMQARHGRNIQHMWLVKRLDLQMMGTLMDRYIG